MKLKDYFATVARVLHHHTIDGEVAAAMSPGELKEAETKTEFNRAIAEVRQALVSNKKLLGVFDDQSETPTSPEIMREKTIDQTDLERHIIKVRYDLRKFATPGKFDEQASMMGDTFLGTLQRILTDLTTSMGIKADKFGEVFGPNEKALCEKPQPRSAQAATILPPPSTRAMHKQAALDAIMGRLRAEGKIK